MRDSPYPSLTIYDVVEVWYTFVVQIKYQLFHKREIPISMLINKLNCLVFTVCAQVGGIKIV